MPLYAFLVESVRTGISKQALVVTANKEHIKDVLGDLSKDGSNWSVAKGWKLGSTAALLVEDPKKTKTIRVI